MKGPSKVPAPKRIQLHGVFKDPGALKRVAADARGHKTLHEMLDVAENTIDVLEHNLRVTREMQRAIVDALGEVQA